MSDESHLEANVGAPKRKAETGKKHTVGRVILVSSLVLALMTSLGLVYLVRHLNGNITGISMDAMGDDRPEKIYNGNGASMNILVMGDDTRTGAGNEIDGEGGGGSDTTILVHLSADRTRAYAISIPRDSIVDRPECGSSPAASDVMWNAAYSVGKEICTAGQLELNADIYVDHFVVIDFNGFGKMVDAVGGVNVCVPEDLNDPARDIFVPAGDPSELSGDEALDYVRARYVGELLQRNDLSRIKRQQTFIAAFVRELKSAGTLTRLDKVVNFLDAATESLTTDDELNSVTRLGKIAMQLQSVGLENVKFVTLPTEYYSRDSDYWGKVFWTPEASQIWKLIKEDKPLPRNLLNGAISAEPPASSAEAQKESKKKGKGKKKDKGKTKPDKSTPESPSESETPTPSETTAPPPTPTETADPIPGVCA